MGISPCFVQQKSIFRVDLPLFFYCSVTSLTGYMFVYKLATLRSFCGGRIISMSGRMGHLRKRGYHGFREQGTHLKVFSSCIKIL